MRPLPTLAVLILAGLLSGCFTRYRQANELAEQGRFVEAAQMFEQLSAENPEDKELVELLGRARYRAVQQALGKARQARLTGNPRAGQSFFAQGLELTHQWAVKLDGALESTVEDEKEDATQRLRALAIPRAQRGEALSAESVVHQHQFLLRFAEMQSLRNELWGAARSSGKATCERIRPNAKSSEPYLTNVLARYCLHFDAPGPPVPKLPDAVGGVRTSVDVARMGPGANGELAGALESALAASPWWAEGGPKAAELSVRGSTDFNENRRTMMLSAPWEESVPYTEQVKKTVEESVPVTECEAYEESDPSTPGHKVSRLREVTKSKTKTREVYVEETRYRNVPRSFDYQALVIERRASYSAKALLSVGADAVAASGQEAADHRSGYQHDVTFEPAGVRPQRPQFIPVEDWYRGNQNALVGRFRESLFESYRAKFCSVASPSLEEAARCARAGEGVAKESLQSLVPLLGEDAFEVPRVVGPAESAKKATVGPAASR